MISDFFVFEQLHKFDVYLPDFNVLHNKHSGDSDSIQDLKKVRIRIDSRYNDFINEHIKKGEAKLPSHINIISWNYDLQFELALAYRNALRIETAQEQLNVYNGVSKTGINQTESNIIKINGTAGLYYPDHRTNRFEHFIRPNKHTFDNDYINDVVEIFWKNKSRVFDNTPFFTFSFENIGWKEDLQNLSQLIIDRTETLIVIGYSFHKLNFEIDSKILSTISKLKKIIIQVP